MKSDDDNHAPDPGANTSRRVERRKRGARPPEWTNGLRQLYDSVVDEPIPDSFKDLLARLDSKD